MQINTDLSGCGIKLAVLQFQRSLTKIIVWSCRNRVQDKQCSPYLTGFLLWDDPCPCPSHLFQGGDGIFLLIRRPAAKHSHILTRVYVVDLQKLESLQLSYLLQHPHTQMWCVFPALQRRTRTRKLLRNSTKTAIVRQILSHKEMFKRLNPFRSNGISCTGYVPNLKVSNWNGKYQQMNDFYRRTTSQTKVWFRPG